MKVSRSLATRCRRAGCRVAKLTSRVLLDLRCDSCAADSGTATVSIRVIAAGNGCTDLQLEHLPTPRHRYSRWRCALSGVSWWAFPGRVSGGGGTTPSAGHFQRAYTVIQARPAAGLQRLRYLLLLWGPIVTTPVSDDAGKRFTASPMSACR